MYNTVFKQDYAELEHRAKWNAMGCTSWKGLIVKNMTLVSQMSVNRVQGCAEVCELQWHEFEFEVPLVAV